MTISARDGVVKDLGTLFDVGGFANLTDGQLLERFMRRDDESSERAIEILVERHGPMVLSVCRNLLADAHDAEDAFQATFLVLIRKAGAIRKLDSCGSWLHGVALREAAGLRYAGSRRRERERVAAMEAEARRDSTPADPPDELPALIHEELGRLREQHRSPLVLCHLEGLSCEEAASRLGWPVGTVKSRLSRGRERLRRQLIRRGIAPTLALAWGDGLASKANAVVPASLAARVVEGARLAARGAAVLTPATLAATVRTELVHGSLRRVLAAGAAMLVIGVAVVASYAQKSGIEDSPALGSVPEKSPRALPAKPPRVQLPPIHARVVDAQGKAVEGAEVIAFTWDQAVSRQRTDREGLVVFDKPRADEPFSLLARAKDAVGGHTHYPPMDLEGGTAGRPLTLVLRPLTHRFKGSVVDMQGRPIAGVRVFGQGLRFEESNLFMQRPFIELESYPFGVSVTDAGGHFELMLPAGVDVPLAFLHPRYVNVQIDALYDMDFLEPIKLQASGRIRGRIIDAASGAPIAGAQVSSQPLEYPNDSNGETGSATSDAEGRFAIGGLEAGVHNVCLSQIPGRPKATALAAEGVRVRADEDETVEFKVFDGRPLKGVVIDPTTNEPRPNAWVVCQSSAYPISGSDSGYCRGDEQGKFQFFVPPGAVFVSLRSPDAGSRGRAWVTIPEEGEVPEVRIVGPSPAPPPAAQPAGIGGTITKTQVVKSVRQRPVPQIPRLPEGRTVIGKVVDGDGRPIVGAKVDARVSKTEKYLIRHVVVDGDGRPIVDAKADARVSKTEKYLNGISTRWNTICSVVSDREGTFIARGLPRGEVTMHATYDRGRESKRLTEILTDDQDTVEFRFLPSTPLDDGIPR